MPDPRADINAAPAEPTRPESRLYDAFIADLELAEVEVFKLSGERIATGAAAQAKFDLAASYSQDDADIYYRYDVRAQFTNEAGAELGHAAASVMVTARHAAITDAACIEWFGGTSGASIAHPYLRETIASAAQRLGFPGVTLPMIKRESDGS